MIRHQLSYSHAGASQTRQNDAISSSVKGKSLMTDTVRDENVMPIAAQPPFTAAKNHHNDDVVDPSIEVIVKNTHQNSSHLQNHSDNWLVCCAQSY